MNARGSPLLALFCTIFLPGVNAASVLQPEKPPYAPTTDAEHRIAELTDQVAVLRRQLKEATDAALAPVVLVDSFDDGDDVDNSSSSSNITATTVSEQDQGTTTTVSEQDQGEVAQERLLPFLGGAVLGGALAHSFAPRIGYAPPLVCRLQTQCPTPPPPPGTACPTVRVCTRGPTVYHPACTCRP